MEMGMENKNVIRFTLNDKPVAISVNEDRMLLWVIRTELGLTGAKFGCGEGFCGACTVLVNDEPIRSCQYPMKEVQGKSVLTIEGLAKNGKLHSLQQAFVDHDALQCGFCTPGIILTAYSLLLKNPKPSQKDVIQTLDDNLCRCGAHTRMLQAVHAAAETMRVGGPR
jgi:aerobic-type carbon monoxide dehydrogenase small subunit (CoxS/CutS family)